MKKAMQAAVAVGLVVVGYGFGRAQTAPLKSGVVTSAQAAVEDSGAWGEFRKSFGGPSLASADVLAGIGDIKAGAENHPPHTHVDEEFLYLAEGHRHLDARRHADSGEGRRHALRRAERAPRVQEHVRQASEVLRGEVENEIARGSLQLWRRGFSPASTTEVVLFI